MSVFAQTTDNNLNIKYHEQQAFNSTYCVIRFICMQN